MQGDGRTEDGGKTEHYRVDEDRVRPRRLLPPLPLLPVVGWWRRRCLRSAGGPVRMSGSAATEENGLEGGCNERG